MAKDPAFLFYHHDFLIGTAFLTLEERGAYITILAYMADLGAMTVDQIQQACGNFKITESLKIKFKINDQGLWYNKRLLDEVEKRKSYCESRRLNKTYDKTHDNHMSGHMVNRNRDRNKVKDITVFSFEEVWSKYPNKLGKKDAQRHFNASVITDQDYVDIKKALENYIAKMKGADPKFIKHGSSWFNNWKDWVNYKTPNTEQTENDQRDEWEKRANKGCGNCRGAGSVYAPGSGKFGKCGCVK